MYRQWSSQTRLPGNGCILPKLKMTLGSLEKDHLPKLDPFVNIKTLIGTQSHFGKPKASLRNLTAVPYGLVVLESNGTLSIERPSSTMIAITHFHEPLLTGRLESANGYIICHLPTRLDTSKCFSFKPAIILPVPMQCFLFWQGIGQVCAHRRQYGQVRNLLLVRLSSRTRTSLLCIYWTNLGQTMISKSSTNWEEAGKENPFPWPNASRFLDNVEGVGDLFRLALLASPGPVRCPRESKCIG